MAVSLAALAFVLGGCTGGGGSDGGSSGGGTAPPPPPPPPPSMIDSESEAVRFLQRATFGPSPAETAALNGSDAADWFRAELNKPPTLFLDDVLALRNDNGDVPNQSHRDVWWEKAIMADDQLRLRMVFALSQILVISDQSGLRNHPETIAHYQDILSRNAFGNYRDLLEEVTYSPAMAEYLTYLRNRKGDEKSGRMPDENYAREIMQLFTIGLVELRPDGTPRLDGAGNEIETYDNEDVTGLSRVFTGLDFKGASRFGKNDFDADARYTPLSIDEEWHSDKEKVFLDTTIPEGTLGAESIDLALDALFNHPNVGPFIGRQLIQRFTVSDPDPDYVERVAAAFDEGLYTLPDGSRVGTGERGDLAATLAAVLFDEDVIDLEGEAPEMQGKVREPVIRFVNYVRAFETDDIIVSNENSLRDTSRTDRLSQQAFRSPSVFNFYRPGFVAPSTATGDADLTAPELQIVNDGAFGGYVDFMTAYARDESGRRNKELLSFTPDYTRELELVEDPQALVDHLDLKLTGQRMDPAAKALIVEAVSAVTLSDNPQKPQNTARDQMRRVSLAITMVVTSPAFMTQP